MLSDPHADLRDQVLRRVLEGGGESPAALRRSAFDGTGQSPGLEVLIDKIHAHAYKVSDADVAKAQEIYGDDRMFEIVVSAALGASDKRLQAGLKALGEA